MDKSRKRGQGTGLGLAIAREIIGTHGGMGMVRAESIEGVGTKVSVLLPVTEVDAETVLSKRRQ